MSERRSLAAAPALASLVDAAAKLRTAGLAESTRSRYDAQVRAWLQFIHELSAAKGEALDPLAAPEAAWTLFVAWLAKRGLKKATVEGYLTAVRSWLRDAGRPQPTTTGLLQRVVKGVERNPLGAPQKPPRPPRFPITVSVLLRMRPFVDAKRLDGSLTWLAALLGVLGLLRCGEFALDPSRSESERARRMLRLRHLRVASDGSSMTLHVPVTKTRQLDGIRVHYAKQADERLCPLHAWAAYRALRQRERPASLSDEEQPLLLTERGRPLLKADIVRRVQLALQAAGLAADDSARFSGHSFRRGGAQSLRDAGLSLIEIKEAGHWKSDSVLRYFTSREAMAARLAPLFARAAGVLPGATAPFVPDTGEAKAALASVPAASAAAAAAVPPAVAAGPLPAADARALSQPAAAGVRARPSSLARLPVR